jgi:hypothetical protein
MNYLCANFKKIKYKNKWEKEIKNRKEAKLLMVLGVLDVKEKLKKDPL